MISLEEVRQVVIAEFKRVHNLAYSTTLVNYANFRTVDIEHQRLPFVDVSILLDKTGQAAIGEQEIFVTGRLIPIFYYQEGRGGQGYLSYTDMLNAELGMQTLNSVHYQAAKPITVHTFPSWIGCANDIKFEVVAAECP